MGDMGAQTSRLRIKINAGSRDKACLVSTFMARFFAHHIIIYTQAGTPALPGHFLKGVNHDRSGKFNETL